MKQGEEEKGGIQTEEKAGKDTSGKPRRRTDCRGKGGRKGSGGILEFLIGVAVIIGGVYAVGYGCSFVFHILGVD